MVMGESLAAADCTGAGIAAGAAALGEDTQPMVKTRLARIRILAIFLIILSLK